jgi:hypothetical protein
MRGHLWFRLMIGLITAAPLLVIVGLFSVFVFDLRPMPPFISRFLIPAIGLSIVCLVGTTCYYHLASLDSVVPPSQRTGWQVALVMWPIFATLIFWYRHVWRGP